jgi:rfaE bifunctional protein nucleotidyltransferase chain/domain
VDCIVFKDKTDLANWRTSFKGKLVFTNGCFDVLKKGHFQHFFESRLLGDFLLVGLNSDTSIKNLKGPERPIFKEEDRIFALASNRYIDGIILFDDKDCSNLIRVSRPTYFTKSDEYDFNEYPEEKKAIADIGSLVAIFKHFGLHSTDIINKLSLTKQ